MPFKYILFNQRGIYRIYTLLFRNVTTWALSHHRHRRLCAKKQKDETRMHCITTRIRQMAAHQNFPPLPFTPIVFSTATTNSAFYSYTTYRIDEKNFIRLVPISFAVSTIIIVVAAYLSDTRVNGCGKSNK